jgi:hypothetical protein
MSKLRILNYRIEDKLSKKSIGLLVAFWLIKTYLLIVLLCGSMSLPAVVLASLP